ncbi:MAG: DMT family transporter [Pseudomonadota bacterium]
MFNGLQDRYKALLLGFFGYGVFVLSDTAVKVLTPHYSIYQIIAATFVFAGVLFMAFSPWLGGVKSLYDPKNAHLHLIRGIANFFGASLVVYFFSILPLTSVYTAMFLSPFIMALIAIPLHGEKVGLYRWISMVIGFIGVLVAFRPWENNMPLWQFGLLMAAPLSFSIMHSMMRIMKEPSDLAMGFYPMLIAFWPMTGMALFVENYVPFAFEHLIYLFISAICITLGFITLSRAFHIADSSLVSPLQYSQMLWGLLIGYFVFRDLPDMWMVGGSVLIIISGLYLIYRERQLGR